MAHSKRNTSRPFFTSYERSLVKSAWSASSARLTRESFLPFGACGLCLEPAQTPVACPRGDLFCRECAVANMLAQRQDRHRHGRAAARATRDDRAARAAAEVEIRAQSVRHFELAQTGAGPAQPPAAPAPDRSPPPSRKRRRVLDPDDLGRAADDDRAMAIVALTETKAAAKPLVSIWAPAPVPSKLLMADEPALASPPIRETAMCPAAREADPHPLTLRDLVTVAFATAQANSGGGSGGGEGGGGGAPICPSCLRALSNASRAVLLKQCGHVLCRACALQLVAGPGPGPPACYVCDAPLAVAGDRALDDMPAVVALRCEGTGFAARGSNKVERKGLAFQC